MAKEIITLDDREESTATDPASPAEQDRSLLGRVSRRSFL